MKPLTAMLLFGVLPITAAIGIVFVGFYIWLLLELGGWLNKDK